jgi:hypothetical protein
MLAVAVSAVWPVAVLAAALRTGRAAVRPRVVRPPAVPATKSNI